MKILDKEGLIYYTEKIKENYALKDDIPTKTSDLENDSDFTNKTYVDGEVKKLDNRIDKINDKVIDTRNELERVKNDILETGEASGSFIHLNDSSMAEFQELSVEGVFKQTKYDGINYFDSFKIKNTTNVAVEEDGTLKVSGVTTSNGFCSLNTTVAELCPNLKAGDEAYLYLETDFIEQGTTSPKIVIYIQGISEIWKHGDKKTITQNLLNNGIVIYGGYNVTSTIRIMITKDQMYNEYEKFVGNVFSPNLDYPQEIEVIKDDIVLTSSNKNIMDLSTVPETNNYNVIVPNPIKEAGTYTVSCLNEYITSGLGVALSFVNELNGERIGYWFTGYNFGSTSFELTREISQEQVNAKYIQFNGQDNRVSKQTLENMKIQLELSPIKTNFVEHIKTQIEVNLNNEFLGKLDDAYKDTIDVRYNEEDGNYHLLLNKNIRHLRLKVADMNNSEDYPGWRNIEQIYNDYPNLSGRNLRNVVMYASNICLGTSNLFQINTKNNIGQIYFDKNIYNLTQTQWKEQYPDLVIDLYYGLKDTSYEIDLGVVDMPLTYDEITNIFTNNEFLPIINAKYYRTFEKTIKNLQVNEKSLNQELIDINNRITILEGSLGTILTELEGI